MIHKDKFGREIYPSAFEKMRGNERVLLEEGYLESKSKPNLFYHKVSEGILFADMRGTDEVPIWDDTSPLFYWEFNDDIPMKKRRIIVKQELERLSQLKCPCRLSFNFYECPEFEGISTMSGPDGTLEWLDDGCKVCGKDFAGDGDFCSKLCEKKFEDSLKKH